jgi:hypothetical protein
MDKEKLKGNLVISNVIKREISGPQGSEVDSVLLGCDAV